MGIGVVLLGLVAALAIVALLPKVPAGALRTATGFFALVVVFAALLFGSVTYVGSDSVGILYKNALGSSLKGGKIIAVDGEMGIQADVLPPGWHTGIWPVIYSVKTVPLTEIKTDEVGIVETSDGIPMDEGQLFAEDWKPDEVQKMLDARYFLTTGKGRKGKQTTVLTPGRYRLNTELYKIKMVKQTEVHTSEVAVLKANYGKAPTIAVKGAAAGSAEGNEADKNQLMLAAQGEMGVRSDVLPPGKYPLNTDAFSVTEIWTGPVIAHYTASNPGNPVSDRKTGGMTHEPSLEEKEIQVRTSDGFTFPVDVRVEYVVESKNAPVVVARLSSDESEQFRNVLNSAVRAIFRDNAEGVKALDYVQQRSHQETLCLPSLSQQMARFGVTITAVRIGNVGDEKTLGPLLKTQTDREIATQEQKTFQEQQKAAMQKKELSRTTQEAEEEKRLATAAYQAKMADELKKQKITEAGAEAEAIKIKALAQAEAYKEISSQIGKTNAALIEVLKIVGEKGISITPRIMITGGGGGGAGGMSMGGMGGTALIGTMLDSMISKDEDKPAPK
jgi:uncharacterized membrane protein YqiK